MKKIVYRPFGFAALLLAFCAALLIGMDVIMIVTEIGDGGGFPYVEAIASALLCLPAGIMIARWLYRSRITLDDRSVRARGWHGTVFDAAVPISGFKRKTAIAVPYAEITDQRVPPQVRGAILAHALLCGEVNADILDLSMLSPYARQSLVREITSRRNVAGADSVPYRAIVDFLTSAAFLSLNLFLVVVIPYGLFLLFGFHGAKALAGLPALFAGIMISLILYSLYENKYVDGTDDRAGRRLMKKAVMVATALYLIAALIIIVL